MANRDQKDDDTGPLEVEVRGYEVVRNPILNKGTGFPPGERRALGIEGLLPYQFNSMDTQAKRIYESIAVKEDALEKYIGLMALQDRNETLYYRVLMDNLDEFMPLVYTPTVGRATESFSHVFRRGRGVWITPACKGRIPEVLRHGAKPGQIRLIVATDGQSILGIGDQGAGGMAISVGKLALYTAGAGIDPSRALPVCLDVGTDNEALLSDELYLGWPHRRLKGGEYEALVDEFVDAVMRVFPGALIQWEDLRKDNALKVLERYRQRVPSFNDDVQGTGAVAAAGLLSSMRVSDTKLVDHRVLVFGAGAAGFGIATRLRAMLTQCGVCRDDLCRHIGVLDSKGLIVDDRDIEEQYKHDLAWPAQFAKSIGLDAPHDRRLPAVVRSFRPTALIGVSGQGGAFGEEVVRAMAERTERPLIMPFSNPNSRAEAVPQDLIEWSGGRALVATGSPFGAVVYGGGTFEIGQGNNVLVFPGLGLGALVAGAREVTDEMVGASALALAHSVSGGELARGLLYPAVNRLREVSRAVAKAAMRQAIEDGVASIGEPEDLDALIEAAMWTPRYRRYVAT